MSTFKLYITCRHQLSVEPFLFLEKENLKTRLAEFLDGLGYKFSVYGEQEKNE